MPRRARMYVAGLPYDLVQRGNERSGTSEIYLSLFLPLTLARYGAPEHRQALGERPPGRAGPKAAEARE